MNKDIIYLEGYRSGWDEEIIYEENLAHLNEKEYYLWYQGYNQGALDKKENKKYVKIKKEIPKPYL